MLAPQQPASHDAFVSLRAYRLWLTADLSRLGRMGLVLLFLTGCERTTSDAPAKLRPCTELGQTCEFSPGKLGSCVVVDGCKRDNCFVCQSQH